MYTIICFSPTGNALHLAEAFAGHIGIEKSEIQALEFTDAKKLKRNKHLILFYPIHGFNPPRTVSRFVKNMPTGLFYTVNLIAVGCTTNWVDDAVSKSLRKMLQKRNYTVAVDEILAMPLTFITAFPEEYALNLINESEKRVEEISSWLKEGRISDRKVSFKSHLVNFIGKVEHPAARLFGLELRANKRCTSCGICWSNCPERNIQKNSKDKPKFGFKCLMCMRCIYNCPGKAISPRISKFIPINKGYSIKQFQPIEEE